MPFRSIVGHRRLLSLLSRAVARDSLAPAILLAGPSGVGKRLTALSIAQTINCLQPRISSAQDDPTGLVRPVTDPVHLERDACGECAACRRIERLVHPDVILIEPADSGSIGVDQLRDVIDRAQYRPFEARRRVVIIDDADAATAAGQTALLKTLEEPPSASTFILVSSMPDALLPTVLSRCPRLRFGPLTPAEIAAVLIRDHEYSEPEARAAAADADGSVGQAIESRDTDLTTARTAVERLLEESARSADPRRRINLARDLTDRKGTPAEERNRLAVHLRALGSLLRDIGIIATKADRALLANADLTPQLERLAGTFDADRSQRAYAAVDRALAALNQNASPKVVAGWLLLQL